MAMSVILNNVISSHLDTEGNTVIDLPVTKSENVDGLDERIEYVAASTFKGIDCGTVIDLINKEEGGS